MGVPCTPPAHRDPCTHALVSPSSVLRAVVAAPTSSTYAALAGVLAPAKALSTVLLSVLHAEQNQDFGTRALCAVCAQSCTRAQTMRMCTHTHTHTHTRARAQTHLCYLFKVCDFWCRHAKVIHEWVVHDACIHTHTPQYLASMPQHIALSRSIC